MIACINIIKNAKSSARIMGKILFLSFGTPRISVLYFFCRQRANTFALVISSVAIRVNITEYSYGGDEKSPETSDALCFRWSTLINFMIQSPEGISRLRRDSFWAQEFKGFARNDNGGKAEATLEVRNLPKLVKYNCLKTNPSCHAFLFYVIVNLFDEINCREAIFQTALYSRVSNGD